MATMKREAVVSLLVLVFVCLSDAKRFQTRDDSLKFIVMGDWGGLPDFPYRTAIERAVAKEMGNIADDIDSQFVLALGDNFYFDGVMTVEDARFQETYELVFTSNSMQRNWYLVAGNHDHNGNVSAQIDYSKLSKRWNYPNFYYKLNFTSPDGATVDIIMIDTVLLCGNSDADYLHLQPSGPDSQGVAEDQWTWIENNIKDSKAQYLIVAGHYPVYSIAEHGPTQCLVDRLDPLLHKYHATAYMCGHEHNIQHLQYSSPDTYNQTVDYFISGAANFIDTSVAHKDSVPAGSSKFHWADDISLGSMSYVEITRSKLIYTFVQANGKVLYQHSVLPRF